MQRFLLVTLLALPFFLNAQSPALPPLGYEQLTHWNRIESTRISHDGNWVMYTLRAEEGDPTLVIVDPQTGEQQVFPRGKDGHFSADNRYAVFRKGAPQDTIIALRRVKTKDKDLPKDTLVILQLEDGGMTQIPRVKSYQLPNKWSGWLAYHAEAALPDTTSTTDNDSTEVVEPKKENKENGTVLNLYRFNDQQIFPLGYVTDYKHAEDAMGWVAKSTGDDSLLIQGVYYFGPENTTWTAVHTDTLGQFGNMALSQQGDKVAYLVHFDTTEARIPPFAVHLWERGDQISSLVADTASSWLPADWIISEHRTPYFSEDGNRLFFGAAPEPILQDTSLLPEEIVEVEVWSWQDTRLYPQQQKQLEQDKKRSWLAMYDLTDQRSALIQEEAYNNLLIGDENKAPYGLLIDEKTHYRSVSWDGFPSRKLIARIDLATGRHTPFPQPIKGTPSVSPGGQFAYWFDYADSTWQGVYLKGLIEVRITENDQVPFYNELHDTPSDPGPYGVAAWMEDDKQIIVYDRYDLWVIDPLRPGARLRITQGRETQTRYRYVKLDPEKRFLQPDDRILLKTFSEVDKTSGFAWLDLKTLEIEDFHFGDVYIGRTVLKARDSEQMVFTLENFELFPDLLGSGPDFADLTRLSTANPQQEDFAWGSIELVEWTTLDGQAVQGMLVKPADFDPNKQYPMIVNFYERSSDGLHRHRAPYPHRSTINYAFYASRGYLIFNPDVPYRVGYPGESAYNSVMPGVTNLLEKGFVDRERIALQGHSWGGYQVAYLLTKTDLFRCAESGAPVVNMTSAYGGIRWGSGLSRMFQYEHTQSRIGGTLWETPLRYLENSPLFFTDKINTPVLILHNDQDGAVPWYQGIEWFVALRRLNKPAWMLNYNNEPHWPLKLQNRKDFNLRMAQFFDHYLQDAPRPQWMEEGVPAIEKGIRQGLEPVESGQ